MGTKKITDLTLRSSVVDSVNIPIDDGIQTYRVTMPQVFDYLWPKFFAVRTVTSPDTVVSTDRILLLDPTSSPFTQPLPACATFPTGVYTFKNIALPSNGNAVTLDANGSELIDEALTLVLNSSPSMDSVDLLNTGAKWLIV